MKKQLIIFIFITVSFGVGAVFAQHGNPHKAKNPEEKAAFMSKKWTNELSLSKSQYVQISPIFLKQYKQLSSIDSLYALNHNKKAMFQAKKAIRALTDTAIKQALTPDQYGHYYRLKSQNRPKRRW